MCGKTIQSAACAEDESWKMVHAIDWFNAMCGKKLDGMHFDGQLVRDESNTLCVPCNIDVKGEKRCISCQTTTNSVKQCVCRLAVYCTTCRAASDHACSPALRQVAPLARMIKAQSEPPYFFVICFMNHTLIPMSWLFAADHAPFGIYMPGFSTRKAETACVMRGSLHQMLVNGNVLI